MATSTRTRPADAVPAAPSRRGRPPGSKNRVGAEWFNAGAARQRLTHIDREIERMHAERTLLVQVLGGGASLAPSAGAVGRAAGRGPGRRPRNGRPSLLDLLEQIMTQGAANKGWTVGELREELAKVDPDRAGAANASALLSSALVQALRAKRARFAGTKGGRGHAREYRLAKA